MGLSGKVSHKGQPEQQTAGLFTDAVPALVLGIGNILLGDEGAGVKAAAELAVRYTLPPEVEMIDGGTMGLELLPYLAGRRLMVIVDAVNTGAAPGTVVRLELDDPSDFFRAKISPHQIGIAEVLGVATITGELPGRVVLIGVVPKDLATGLDFSPEVAAQIPRMAAMVAAELEAAGFVLQPRNLPGD